MWRKKVLCWNNLCCFVTKLLLLQCFVAIYVLSIWRKEPKYCPWRKKNKYHVKAEHSVILWNQWNIRLQQLILQICTNMFTIPLLTNGRKYKQRWQSFEWPFRCFVSNYNILIDLSGCEFSPKAVGLRPQKLAQSSTSSPHLQLQPLTDWLYKDSEISPPTLSKKIWWPLSFYIGFICSGWFFQGPYFGPSTNQ